MRADLALAALGLARSRSQARSIIAQGRARLDGKVLPKASTEIPAGARLTVDEAPDGIEYASRGAFKLLGALEICEPLGLEVAGRDALDAGASTGGFTDVLLRRGIARVVAADVGHDQLDPRLAADPRVVVRDGCNVRALRPADLPYRPQLVVSDLSFIPLGLVLDALADVSAPGADLLLMVKPQFEVGREALPSSGVVTDPAAHVGAVSGVVVAARRLGLALRTVAPSPLPGPSGNREFFVWLRAGDPDGTASEHEMIDRAVREAHEGGAT